MLDMKTLMLLYLIINVISAGAVALIWRQNRGRFPGISFWLADMVLQATGSTLIALRGVVPNIVSMTISNTLILAGALLILIGLERFTGKKGPHLHNFILLAVFAAVSAYFTEVQPNLMAREIAGAVIAIIFTFQCCWLLLRRTDRGLRQITQLTGIVFAFYAAFSLARIILNLIWPDQSNDFFKSGAVDALAITAYIILSACLTVSLVLMVNQRLLGEVGIQDAKLNTIFRAAPYAIILARLSDGTIFEVNDSFEMISGYRRVECVGKTTSELRLWYMKDNQVATIKDLAQEHDILGAEYEFRRKNGGVVTGHFSASLVTIENEIFVLAFIADISKRKLVEQALRHKQIMIERTESIAHIGSWEWDIATDTVNWSDELFRIFQRDPKEGAPSFAEHPAFYHPDDMARLQQAVQVAVADGTPYKLELRTIRKDGETRICMTRGVAEIGRDGRPVRLVGSLQDITERKQTEKIIERQVAEYRTIFDTVRPMIAYLDGEGVIQRINKSGSNTFGLEPKDIVGKTMHDFFPAADADKYNAENNQVIATGKPIIGAITDYELPSGQRGWAQIDRLPYRNENGDVTGVVTFNRDITRQKLAAEMLYENEQKFRNVFDNSPVGKSITSIDGAVNVNQAFADMLGYTIEELKHVKWQDISLPEEIESINEKLKTLLEGRGKFARFLKRYVKKDGSMMWADVNTVLQRDKDGQPLYYITAIVDITKRRLAEQEIIRLNTELEQRVLDRTALLEAANRELETFAYSVSHDLRAPLRGIDGWSLALLQDCKGKLNEQEREYIDLVRSETQTMSRLIDDLLTFSRQSRAEMSQQQLDMTAMAQAIVDHLREQNPLLKADFIVQPGLAATGDPSLIKIALSNLIDNATKFSSKNADSRVEFGQVEIEGRKAFFVRDNGVGFDMAYAHKLFGVFRRLHKASEFPGTGIGLASVQRIILRHGGTIWADARVNQGATFYFTLKEAQ